MKLGNAPGQYDQRDEGQTRAAIQRADGQNHKTTGNIEVGAGKVIILTDTVTGARWALSVASGALHLASAP